LLLARPAAKRGPFWPPLPELPAPFLCGAWGAAGREPLRPWDPLLLPIAWEPPRQVLPTALLLRVIGESSAMWGGTGESPAAQGAQRKAPPPYFSDPSAPALLLLTLFKRLAQ